MIITKKFSKFYLNTFEPVTKLEQTDVERSRYMYRAFTIGGACAFGYVSFKIRRGHIGAQGVEHAARENELAMNMLNDALSGLLGFFIGHFISCDYMYKHRQYVLQRIYLENTRGVMNRKSLLKEPNVMLLEYPLRDSTILLDKDLIEDRLNPEEAEENTKQLKERVEKWEQNYNQQ
jgi:hypothetical protein